MTRAIRLVGLFALAFGVTTVVHGQDAKPVEGLLSLSKKPYQLQHAVAYETKVFDKPAIAIIASDRSISLDAVKQALLDKKGDGDVSLRQPHVKLVFDNSGKVSSYYATAAGFTTSAGGDAVTGEIKRDGDRVTGKAKMPPQGEGDLERSFDFQFALGLIGTTAEAPQTVAPLAKLGVSGIFKGNGKDSRLAFVSARPREPFADKPSIMLIFTERDHTRDPRADFKAGFGDFGSALIISCHEDGNIFGCEVAHAAHPKKPFSALGTIAMTEFQVAGGQVQGQLSTGGETKAFDQTWEVNVKFAAPFAGPAKPPQAKKSTGNSVRRSRSQRGAGH